MSKFKCVWFKKGYPEAAEWDYDWCLSECDKEGEVKVSGTTKLIKGYDSNSYKLMYENLRRLGNYFCVAIFRRQNVNSK